MICVYPADCTDFSTNGNGTIEPSSAQVMETLNGEYELQLVHPIDEAGKWQRLVEGCILRAPVPAATTPRVHFSAPGDDSGTEIYRINTDFAGAETRKGTLNLRAGPGRNYKILAAYKNTLTVQVIAKTSSAWYEVTAPDGKHGYMDTTYLVFDHREGSASEAVSSVVEERQLRDQPFRIYRIVPDLDKITVYARHVFYDLLDNISDKAIARDGFRLFSFSMDENIGSGDNTIYFYFDFADAEDGVYTLRLDLSLQFPNYFRFLSLPQKKADSGYIYQEIVMDYDRNFTFELDVYGGAYRESVSVEPWQHYQFGIEEFSLADMPLSILDLTKPATVKAGTDKAGLYRYPMDHDEPIRMLSEGELVNIVPLEYGRGHWMIVCDGDNVYYAPSDLFEY